MQLPKESRTKLKLTPANEWGWNEVLLNQASYFLQVLAWQNTDDAHSKHPLHAPELWLPDFMPKPKKEKHSEEAAMDLDDLKAFLSKPRS